MARIEIHCGDCLEILESMDTDSVDYVITDPPITNIEVEKWGHIFRHLRRVTRWGISLLTPLQWYDGHLHRTHIRLQRPHDIFIIPLKGNGYMGFARVYQYFMYEECVGESRDLSYMPAMHEPLDVPVPGPSDHPGKKPEELMRMIIEHVTLNFSGHSILDPFMGSGATGEAAYTLGHSFFGIEVDKNYCQQAQERLLNLVGYTESDLSPITKEVI